MENVFQFGRRQERYNLLFPSKEESLLPADGDGFNAVNLLTMLSIDFEEDTR